MYAILACFECALCIPWTRADTRIKSNHFLLFLVTFNLHIDTLKYSLLDTLKYPLSYSFELPYSSSYSVNYSQGKALSEDTSRGYS